jgi:UDP-GlcNAc:undecaprenyl-phosphate GlcNAc-1-phosphate transferase
MESYIHLLQTQLHFHEYKFALLCFVTAFVVALLAIPPIIHLSREYKLYDVPNERKVHSNPIPTMWFPFTNELWQIAFLVCSALLFVMGIMDDLKDLSAKYKFIVQIALAAIIALSGTRITSFDGLFGINELPLYTQYTFTVLAIVGITNAFNLVDGIDGLAGGLGFMSLLTVGLFLSLSGDTAGALIAFALAGSILAFLHYNFSPARIFMGDTGSLVLGFVISVLCIRLLKINASSANPVIHNLPVFILGIVLIPVFDTVRVFSVRIWKGKSPFEADKTHIHHLLTNSGFSHVTVVRVICFIHAIILLKVYLLQGIRQEFILLLLILLMIAVIYIFKYSAALFGKRNNKLKTYP